MGRAHSFSTLFVLLVAACGRLSGLDDLRVVDCPGCSSEPTSQPNSNGGGTVRIEDPSPSSGDATPADADTSVADASGDADGGDGGSADGGPADSGVDAAPPKPCAGPTAHGPAFVQVGGFCIDATEVTIAQYGDFLASHGASIQPGELPASCAAKANTYTPDSWTQQKGRNGALPVTYVDWCDATAYCKWAGKRLCGAVGGGPSQVAWAGDATKDQYYAACSQSGARPYPYGSSYVSGACNEKAGGSTSSLLTVASLTTCQGGYSGIFDLSGNAYEWTDACSANGSLSDGCSLRGGSYLFGGAPYASCAAYFNDYPVLRSARYNDTGFRCCSL